MVKAFGFLGFVLALWVVMELFTNGTENAFGGAFASDSQDARPTLQTARAADALESSYDESMARVDRALE